MAMTDISAEIAAFRSAKYGEEVRGSMISLAEKLRDAVDEAIDNQVLQLDTSLTISGRAADAAVVGNRLSAKPSVSTNGDEIMLMFGDGTDDGGVSMVGVEMYGKVGKLADLNTAVKTTIVAAINDLLSTVAADEDDIVLLQTSVGSLSSLTTSTKTNLVAAINSVNSDVQRMSDEMQDIGISDSIANALLACFEHTAWVDENGRTYYNTLKSALGK